MSDQTPNLKIKYISQSQSQKEVTINEAMLKLDSLLNLGIKTRSLAAPPSSPLEGDAYIIAASATGAWAGKDKQLAIYNNDKGWFFIEPKEGLTLWLNDENKLYSFDGTNWVEPVPTLNLNNLSGVGVNASYDSTNKLTVASDAVLFNHNGNGVNIKVNKNAAANTGSYIFQTGYSGRAEFGLIGNDDFTLKTSANGSTWNESLIIKKDNSYGQLKTNFYTQGISFNNGTDILSNFSSASWTPVITGATTAGTNSYTQQTGYYTRIGNLIIADYAVTVSGSLSSTGALRLSGLPFNPNSACQFSAITNITSSVLPTGSHIYLEAAGSVNYCSVMYFTSSGKAAVASSAVGTGLSLKGTLIYRI